MNRKPTINVICNNINQPLLKWVLAGIEEEGIPVQTTFRDEVDWVKAAYQAAEDSVLGVGVALGENGTVIIHYHRLHPYQPLFKQDKVDDTLAKTMGINAARLVKGKPFELSA